MNGNSTLLPSLLCPLNKRFWSALLAVGIVTCGIFASPLPAKADTIPEHVITTQGHGEIKVRPDSLNVSVSVETKKPTLAAARAENNQKMQAIIASLKGLNIPNLKLETQNVNVYPVQDYQNNKLPKIIGYQATNSLSVTVTNAAPDALGDIGSKIVDTALNVGASNVGGLNFYLTNVSAARQQALELAVKDARGNADAMARAAGVAISGLHSLEGSPQFNTFRPAPMYTMKAARAEADTGSVPVETGENTITSDVTARFNF